MQRLDANDLAALSQAMLDESEALAGMAHDVAAARTIREFAGDRRKRSLALAVREFLTDESAAAAETRGRASVGYGEALITHEADLRTAEQVLSAYDAKLTRWKSLQSALSALRSTAATY